MARRKTVSLIEAMVGAESMRKYDPVNKVNPALAVIQEVGKDPVKSNTDAAFPSKTEAEYGAIEHLLSQAIANKSEVRIRTMNPTIIKQLSGEYKVTKPSLVKRHATVVSLLKELGDKAQVYFHMDVKLPEEPSEITEKAFDTPAAE